MDELLLKKVTSSCLLPYIVLFGSAHNVGFGMRVRGRMCLGAQYFYILACKISLWEKVTCSLS